MPGNHFETDYVHLDKLAKHLAKIKKSYNRREALLALEDKSFLVAPRFSALMELLSVVQLKEISVKRCKFSQKKLT